MTAAAGAGWSWDLVADVRQMWSYHFMLNAFRAGTVVAVTAAVVGWFMVLRRQAFAGHTLAVVAFPGAAGAAALGVSTVYGYFGASLLAAVVIGAARSGAPTRGTSAETAVIGTVQAFALACGYLFATLYHGFLGGVSAPLFGSFLGITDHQLLGLAAAGAVTVLALAVIGRPLTFASVDPAVAAARGVPVRALGTVFLLLLGVAAAAASQITGALLVFALLVMPPATAQRLTSRPVLGLLVAVAIGLLATWVGLTIAYYTAYPVGFAITTPAFAGYLLAAAWPTLRPRRRPTSVRP